jgi:2-methylcitrate dehydratase PrpD
VYEFGTESIWPRSSLKPFPACRTAHRFIELADEMRKKRNGEVHIEHVRAIEVRMPPVSLLLIGDPIPNKIHLENRIDAPLSAYFQAGSALLYRFSMVVRTHNMLDDSGIVAL